MAGANTLWRSWATANAVLENRLAQNSPHSPTRRFCVNNKAIMEGDLLPLMHMEIIGRDPRKYYEDLDVLYPTGPSVEHVLSDKVCSTSILGQVCNSK